MKFELTHWLSLSCVCLVFSGTKFCLPQVIIIFESSEKNQIKQKQNGFFLCSAYRQNLNGLIFYLKRIFVPYASVSIFIFNHLLASVFTLWTNASKVNNALQCFAYMWHRSIARPPSNTTFKHKCTISLWLQRI